METITIMVVVMLAMEVASVITYYVIRNTTSDTIRQMIDVVNSATESEEHVTISDEEKAYMLAKQYAEANGLAIVDEREGK